VSSNVFTCLNFAIERDSSIFYLNTCIIVAYETIEVCWLKSG
jgi:hypothetical protein